jgi:hypothetical protein
MLDQIFYKSIFLSSIILLMLFSQFGINKLSAQTDSLSYTQEAQQDSSIAYLSPMEYAFMMHEETNWLLKANLLMLEQANGRYYLNTKFSLEKRIAKGFSLNAVLFDYTHFASGDVYSYDLSFSLESRWYYKMRKNIREKKSEANLSGAYFALGAAYRKSRSKSDKSEYAFNNNSVPIFVKWGMQSRFLKRGYVDFGVATGSNISLNDGTPTTFFLSTYVDAGLAFTRDKQKLDFDKLCPVLRCHAADKFLLKTNLVDIIDLTYLRKTLIGSFRPNISAEIKLGTSPFSINTKLSGGLIYSKDRYNDIYTFKVAPTVLIEGRWFYNLHRRMLMGKSGNGLSANYIALGGIFRGEYRTTKYTSDGHGYKNNIEVSGIILRTGIQRLISEHLYFDLNFGIGYGVEKNYVESTKRTSKENTPIGDFGIAIGYRF